MVCDLWFRLIVCFNLKMVSSLMVCNCKCLLCQLSDRKKARKKSNNFATKWKGRDHLPSHYNPIVGVKLRGKNHVYANSHFIALKREYYLPTLSNLRMYIPLIVCLCPFAYFIMVISNSWNDTYFMLFSGKGKLILFAGWGSRVKIHPF